MAVRGISLLSFPREIDTATFVNYRERKREHARWMTKDQKRVISHPNSAHDLARPFLFIIPLESGTGICQRYHGLPISYEDTAVNPPSCTTPLHFPHCEHSFVHPAFRCCKWTFPAVFQALNKMINGTGQFWQRVFLLTIRMRSYLERSFLLPSL